LRPAIRSATTFFWDDDAEHADGHDRADERADMQICGAVGKDRVIEEGRRGDQDENRDGERHGLAAQRRLAKLIVDDPADGQ
jgi:hypothetical protein